MKRRLQIVREARKMSQQEVADYLGITVQYYQRIEVGKQIGHVAIWDSLEDLFGIHQRILRQNEDKL